MWRDSSTQMDTIEYDYRSTVQLFGTITIGFFWGVETVINGLVHWLSLCINIM